MSSTANPVRKREIVLPRAGPEDGSDIPPRDYMATLGHTEQPTTRTPPKSKSTVRTARNQNQANKEQGEDDGSNMTTARLSIHNLEIPGNGSYIRTPDSRSRKTNRGSFHEIQPKTGSGFAVAGAGGHPFSPRFTGRVLPLFVRYQGPRGLSPLRSRYACQNRNLGVVLNNS